MKRLGIDFDETLFETLEGVCKYKSKSDHKEWNKSMFKSYKWNDVFGGTEDESLQLFRKFCNSEFHENSAPLENAVEYVNLLSQKYKLNVITFRPDILRENTVELAKKNYGDVFENFHLVGNIFYGVKSSKLEVCKSLNIDTIIDDNFSFVEDCIYNGLNVLLLNKPWNVNVNYSKHKNLTRVNDWREIYEILK